MRPPWCGRIGGRSPHHFDEVRRLERGAARPQRQPFVARLSILLRRQAAGIGHAAQHRQLAGARGRQALPRIERRRPLRQRGEKRRLRRRQHRGVDAEIDPARAPRTGRLVAVGGEIEIEREDLALAEAVLEPEREQHLAHLGAPAAARHALPPLDQQLGDLLRDGRAPLDDLPFHQIVPRRADERDRIDADVRVEAPVLGRERRGDQHRRQVIRVERRDPRPGAAERFVKHRAVPIDDHRRRRVDARQQLRRHRCTAQPDGKCRKRHHRRRNDTAPTQHLWHQHL